MSISFSEISTASPIFLSAIFSAMPISFSMIFIATPIFLSAIYNP
jgi:hypothetical protein